jgi:hypothetical protein
MSAFNGHKIHYHTTAPTQTCRYRFAPPYELRTHELRADGMPLCGESGRDWRGQTPTLVPLGPGPVTCGRCARIHDN